MVSYRTRFPTTHASLSGYIKWPKKKKPNALSFIPNYYDNTGSDRIKFENKCINF